MSAPHTPLGNGVYAKTYAGERTGRERSMSDPEPPSKDSAPSKERPTKAAPKEPRSFLKSSGETYKFTGVYNFKPHDKDPAPSTTTIPPKPTAASKTTTTNASTTQPSQQQPRLYPNVHYEETTTLYQQRASEREKEEVKWKDEVTKWKEEANRWKEEVFKWKDEVTKCKEEGNKWREDANRWKEEVNKLKDGTSKLQEEARKNLELRRQVETLRGDNALFCQQLDISMQRKHGENEEHLRRHLEEIVNLNAETEVLRERMKQQAAEIRELTEANNALVFAKLPSNAEVSESEATIRRLHDEIRSMQADKERSGLKVNDLSILNQKQAEEIGSLKLTINNLEKLRGEVQKLRSEGQKKAEQAGGVDAQKKIEALHAECGALRRENEVLAQKQLGYDTNSRKLQETIASLAKSEDKVSSLSAANKKQIEEISTLKASNTKLGNDATTLRSSLNESIKNLEDRNAQMIVASERLRKLQENMADVEKANGKLQGDLGAATKNIEEAKKSISELRTENDSLRREVAEKQAGDAKTISEQREKIGALSEELAMLGAQARKRHDELNSEVKVLQDKLGREVRLVEELKKEISGLHVSESELQLEIEDWQEKHAIQAKLILAQKEESERREEITYTTATAVQQQVEELEAEVSLLQEKVDGFEHSCAGSKQEVQELEARNGSLQQELETLQQTNVHLEHAVSSLRSEVMGLERERTHIKVANSKLEKDSREHLRLIDEMRRQREEYEASVKQELNRDNQAKVPPSKGVPTKGEEQKLPTEGKKKADEMIREIRSNIQEKSVRAELLEQERKQLRKQVAQLSEEVKKLRMEKERLESEVASIRDVKGELERMEGDVFSLLNFVESSRTLASQLHSHIGAAHWTIKKLHSGFSGGSRNDNLPAITRVPVHCRSDDKTSDILALLNAKGEQCEPPIEFYLQEKETALALLLTQSASDQAEQEKNLDWEDAIQDLGYKIILRLVVVDDVVDSAIYDEGTFQLVSSYGNILLNINKKALDSLFDTLQNQLM